ncbi:MAG: pitrilysin family protein [Candidatus Acidiferrales bacterium]
MTPANTQVAPPRPTNAPSLGPERPVAWPKRTVRTLSNGMQVVLAESRAFPKISAQLFFRSGNAVVARSNPGIAGMTATVVRTGTASRTSRQIEEDLRRMGADLGSHAGADTSAISVSGLAEFSRQLLELMADLAQNASFPEDEFERERRQRFEELRIERTTPGFLANERFRRVLFGEHPYAIIAPSEEHVASYRREQLADYYQKHYVPSGSLLAIVGDFAADAMLDEVEKIFGAWKAPAADAVAFPAPPRHSGRKVHVVHLPGTVQTQIVLGNLGITRRDADWYRVVLANSIYGGAFHSRLVLNIREQKGYTYSPRSGNNALREYGYFTVHAAVRNDVVAATLAEIFYEMDRMRSLPVTHYRRTRKRPQLSQRRLFPRCRYAGWGARPAFQRISRALSRKLSGNVPRPHSRADRRGHPGRRAPPFRQQELRNRRRGRSRPGLRTGRPLRRCHRVHSAGSGSSLRKAHIRDSESVAFLIFAESDVGKITLRAKIAFS